MISFGPATELNPLVADAEFLHLIDWDPAAPKTLRQSAQSGDWQCTIRLLVTRPAGGALVAPDADAQKLSLWSLHHLECPQRASRLLASWQAFRPARRMMPGSARFGTNGRRRKNGRVSTHVDQSGHELAAATDEWLNSAFQNRPIWPLELLILFEILHDAAPRFPIDLAARLWRATLAISIEQLTGAAPTRRDSQVAIDPGEALGQAALKAELAWQAGLLFAPVAGSATLRDAGRAALWDLLANSSDSSGVPAARALRELPVWMASVVRAREWGQRFGRPLFSVSQEKRVRGIVNAVAKFCRENGRPALTGHETNGWVRVWSTAAAAFPPRLQQASPAVGYLLSLGRTKYTGRTRVSPAARNGSRRNGTRRHNSSRAVFQSDESRLACLRSDWSAAANSVLVAHHGRFPALEAAFGDAALLVGDWEIDLRIDGRPVEPAEWSCVCWHSDDDGDYLELQTRPAGLRVERQIFLSRTDDFALFADAVLADREAKVESTSRLTLAPDCAALAQNRTRECRLLFGSAAARVFPLALNCARGEAAAGQLCAAEGRLELSQSGIGGLYTPLVLDWNPRRRRSPVCWRRLTVARDGAAVPSSGAAGFLLETGPSKWLIYRSLRPTLEPRSVLGQHTMYETIVGRFVHGDLEPMVQVEQATESGE